MTPLPNPSLDVEAIKADREPGEDWELELRACGWANDKTMPEDLRQFVSDLWRAYCDMEQRSLSLIARTEAAEAEATNGRDALEDLRIEYGHAQREARDLAVWLHKTYYADVTDWKPFDHASALLSQIDNMVAGVRDRLAKAEGAAREHFAAAQHNARACSELRDIAGQQKQRADAAEAREAELIARCDALVEITEEMVERVARVFHVATASNPQHNPYEEAHEGDKKWWRATAKIALTAALTTITTGGGADV